LSDASAETHQEADDRADQEHDEQHFRDARSAYGDAAESEKCRHQGDDEEYDCIVKHERTFQ
jgi:hypothetical protein